MGNHYHLAIRTRPVPLSRSIGYMQFRFGQDYNRRHRSAGPLWQSRFKSKLVEDQRYLVQLVAYIHLNPVSAGIVKDPAEHGLSGHRELLAKDGDPLVAPEQTLMLFGDTLREARRLYVRALEGVEAAGWRTCPPGGLPWWGHETDRPLDPPPPAAWIDEQGLSTGRDRRVVSASEFLDHCAGLLGVSMELLAGRRRDASTSRLRFLIVALGIERWRQRPGNLAACLGRWPEAVGRWAQRGGQLRLEDEEFRSAYEALDERLARKLES